MELWLVDQRIYDSYRSYSLEIIDGKPE